MIKIFSPGRFPETRLLLFFWPCGDNLYHQMFNNSFHGRLKSIQYSAALPIISTIEGSSRKKTRTRIRIPTSARMVKETLSLFQNDRKQFRWYLFELIRSSHSEVFLGKGVLKICIKFTGEHPYRSAVSI